jgi:hypothetical protein
MKPSFTGSMTRASSMSPEQFGRRREGRGPHRGIDQHDERMVSRVAVPPAVRGLCDAYVC